MNTARLLQLYASEHAADPDVRVVRPMGSDEQGALAQQKTPYTRLAEVAEHGSLQAVAVRPAPRSGLTHFLDGIQRSRQVMYIGSVPIVWGYAAACIRARGEDRLMRTFSRNSRDAIAFPFALVDPGPLESFGFDCLDSAAGAIPAETHPEALKMLGVEAVSAMRERLESALLSDWDGSRDGRWLVADGPVSGYFRQGKRGNVVGLIKSHHTRYFEGEQFQQLMSLPECHRTSVFRLPGKQPNEGACSWYLRLHPDPAADLSFGLVRVEADLGGDFERADLISSWVLAERCPLSLPDSRWDTMIYPIRDCEQYLRAVAPSHTELEGRLGVQVMHRAVTQVQ